VTAYSEDTKFIGVQCTGKRVRDGWTCLCYDAITVRQDTEVSHSSHAKIEKATFDFPMLACPVPEWLTVVVCTEKRLYRLAPCFPLGSAIFRTHRSCPT